MTKKNGREFQNFYISPHLAVDWAQWDWGYMRWMAVIGTQICAKFRWNPRVAKNQEAMEEGMTCLPKCVENQYVFNIFKCLLNKYNYTLKLPANTATFKSKWILRLLQYLDIVWFGHIRDWLNQWLLIELSTDLGLWMFWLHLKLPSLFAAWLCWTFHNKSHTMKALCILCHSSWSRFLPHTCLYGKKWSFVGLSEAFWSIFARKNSSHITHANHMTMTTTWQI